MLLTVAVCLVSSFAFAEVVTPAFSTSGNWYHVPESYQSIKYIAIDKSEGQQILFEYYNPDDFSLVKQINFTIQETDYEISNPQVILEQFVFVAVYKSNLDYGDNNRYNAKLYDTNGNIIYDFGFANYLGRDFNDLNYIRQISPSKVLFLITKELYFGEDEWEFNVEYYYLTITENKSGMQNVQVEKKAVFPCPAREVVNIPTSAERGRLYIRNTQGKIMKSQSLNGSEYQQVNTSNFPAGTYIYQTEAESGSFIVK